MKVHEKHCIQMWAVALTILVLLGTATDSLADDRKISDSHNVERSSVNVTERVFSDDLDSNKCTCVQYYRCSDNDTIVEEDQTIIDIGVKDGGCSHYLHKCCARGKIRPFNDPLLPQPRPVKSNNSCGNRNIEGIDQRISNLNYKEEAKYGEFPWMVAVISSAPNFQQGNSVEIYQCGASLIHPQVVLTGAHCVLGKTNMIIRAGEWDTQTKDEFYPTQDRRVTEVIVHEQYSKTTVANDVALLILESPVDLSEENVGLICLPEANETMDDWDCIVSGWGKNLYGKEGKYSVILKYENTWVVPRLQCQEALRMTRLGSRFTLHESFICAGGHPHSSCLGDGGAPLSCSSRNNPHSYVQAGIVAWSIGCGSESPSVYVNIPSFVDWINEKMQARNIS